MDDHHEVLSELRAPTSSLRHAIPDAWAGFLSLHQGALTVGEFNAEYRVAASAG